MTWLDFFTMLLTLCSALVMIVAFFVLLDAACTSGKRFFRLETRKGSHRYDL